MPRPHGVLLVVLLIGLGVAAPRAALGQSPCQGEYDSFTTACFLGSPTAAGVTLTDALTHSGQVRAYKFQVGPDRQAAHLYLGDLWYDVDLYLYHDPPDEREIGRWFVNKSAESGSRVVQFERPEIIVQDLDPGTYTLFVNAGDSRSFDPNRRFTVRLALGPPVCNTAQAPDSLYQVGLTFEPRQPTAFSLMSFNAFVSPPYTDLFDFDWQLDGRPMSEAVRETLQIAASDLPAAGREHRVQVTARGVRPYPDPDPRFRIVPPTISVECSFPSP
jgi:hypothetical protein